MTLIYDLYALTFHPLLGIFLCWSLVSLPLQLELKSCLDQRLRIHSVSLVAPVRIHSTLKTAAVPLGTVRGQADGVEGTALWQALKSCI